MRLDGTVGDRLPDRCMTGTLIHTIVYSCCQDTSSVCTGLQIVDFVNLEMLTNNKIYKCSYGDLLKCFHIV